MNKIVNLNFSFKEEIKISIKYFQETLWEMIRIISKDFIINN